MNFREDVSSEAFLSRTFPSAEGEFSEAPKVCRETVASVECEFSEAPKVCRETVQRGKGARTRRELTEQRPLKVEEG